MQRGKHSPPLLLPIPSQISLLPAHSLLTCLFSSLHLSPTEPTCTHILLHLLPSTNTNTFHTLPTLEYHRKYVVQNSCPRGCCWLCSCPAPLQHLDLRLLHHCSVEEQHCSEPEDIVDPRCQHCSHWQLQVCSFFLTSQLLILFRHSAKCRHQSPRYPRSCHDQRHRRQPCPVLHWRIVINEHRWIEWCFRQLP
jgi:hypothetical protein